MGTFLDDHGHRCLGVQVTPRIICDLYNVPYYENDFIDEIDLEYFRDIDMDNIINFLTKGRGEWKYHASTNISVSFHQAIMFPEAKMWIQFVCTRIVLTLNVSNVNVFRVVLVYAIFQKKICVGKWIHQNMRRCISSQKVGVFFPHLVTALCKKAGVLMTSTK
ncbi:hypothetical protein V6Z11_D10G156900 [Gossypium hirsutum]